MVRVVLDTVVFVRGLINPHGPWGHLLFERSASYRLIVSPPLVAEVIEVTRRPRIVRKYPSLAGRDVGAVLALLAEAEVVEPGAIPAVSRDPKDDKVLATAAAGGADYLVSEDEDLLVLGRHAGTMIVTARAFLAMLDREADA